MPDDPNAQAGQIESLVSNRLQRRQAIEQATLAAALVEMVRSPGKTWGMIHEIATMPMPRRKQGSSADDAPPRPAPAEVPSAASDTPVATETNEAAKAADTDFAEAELSEVTVAPRLEVAVLAMRVIAFLLAWIGNSALVSVSRSGIIDPMARGIAFLLAGGGVWAASEVIANWGNLRAWWERRNDRARASQAAEPEPTAAENVREKPTNVWGDIHPVRLVLLVVGGVATLFTITFNAENQFTLIGFFVWMVSIIAMAGALASNEALFRPRSLKLRVPPFWRSGTFYALVAIVIIGASFRLYQLDRTPPQMTSDHVEKLLDSQRVLDGNTQVFFPNNGGREPFQMYAMAILSQVPGLGMNFYTLKLLSVIEGVFTLPFLWWMAREVIGRQHPRLGNTVGLILALLVAVSHWHLSLSRLALRIVLTPLIAAWLLIYLGRGMRTNNRDDWLKAGLVLGAGLYMYQAVRMLPVVVIVGALIAVIAKVRRRYDFVQYAINFASLVLMSVIVFVPMLTFSLQFPDLFWRRTAGRLFGDSTITETLEDGTVISRTPTFGEQVDAFRENMSILGANIRDAVLMFNWKGDVAWINNAPNVPQMDHIVGALFVLGLVAWLVRMIRRRDVVDWLVPLMLFIMLMPSALSIAYPVENPSATRTSGALPVAYLIAAYPLALMVFSIRRLIPMRIVAFGVSVLLVGLIAFGSIAQNAETYLERYHDNYLLSSLPYEQGGDDMRAFNQEVGTPGNAFMIAYPYWWDHRALGLAAGYVDFPNGIVTLEGVPQFIFDSYQRTDEYRFDPNKDILFFHAAEDGDTLQQLMAWFPEGDGEFVEVPQQRRSYAMYRVPALGEARFLSWVERNLNADTDVE